MRWRPRRPWQSVLPLASVALTRRRSLRVRVGLRLPERKCLQGRFRALLLREALPAAVLVHLGIPVRRRAPLSGKQIAVHEARQYWAAMQLRIRLRQWPHLQRRGLRRRRQRQRRMHDQRPNARHRTSVRIINAPASRPGVLQRARTTTATGSQTRTSTLARLTPVAW